MSENVMSSPTYAQSNVAQHTYTNSRENSFKVMKGDVAPNNKEHHSPLISKENDI